MAQVTIPGSAANTPGTQIVETFNSASGLTLAQQIAAALLAAVSPPFLTVTSVSGAGAVVPPPPSNFGGPGQPENELVLGNGGPYTIPAGSANHPDYVVVLDNSTGISVTAQPTSTIVGGMAPVTITGGSLIALADAASGASPADTVILRTTDTGASVAGNNGADTLKSFGNNNTITTGVGTNFVAMGGSGDLANVNGSGDAVWGGASAIGVNDTGTNDVIGLGAGGGNVTLSGSGARAYGLEGVTAVVGAVISGTNNGVINLGTGPVNATITGGSADGVAGGGGALTVDQTGGSGDGVYPGTGSLTATIGGAATTVYGAYSSSESVTVNAANAVIGASSGLANVLMGASGSGSVYGWSGTLNFVGGALAATVYGGSGAETLTAGTGALIDVSGAGNTTILGSSGPVSVEGSGSVTLFGANGIVGTDASSGAFLFEAGGGNETLNASQSTGPAYLIGGTVAGSAVSMVGGKGSNVLIAGVGNDTLVAGSGPDAMWFYKPALAAAPHDFVSNFNVADNVFLLGYGAGAAAAALTNAVSAGGSTTLTLSDNTQITFNGVASASGLTGHIFST